MRQGRIRHEDIEEVRRRANLVEVASEHMQLKRAGRQFRGLCPFHNEKTPSFYVDPLKNLYLCHGCGEGGDTIRLIEKLENLTFPEAIERLARLVGVDLRYEQLSGADRAAMKRRSRLIDAHREAVELYHQVLLTDRDAEDARAYLKSRGISKASAEAFKIGFAKMGTVRTLRAKGFEDAELLEAGLAVQGESGGVTDRFRGRVMFPIFDVTGEPVAFGGRRLGEHGPKYINSAESPIYKKSQVLYALNWAKGGIVKAGRALFVEGYTDVIALHQAGITTAVATCGTALGLEHLRSIQRFTQQVVLSLDADEAGGHAADRTYDQLMGDAQQMGLSLKVVLMPEGQDPADSIGVLGADGFNTLIEDAVPLLEFVLRREARRYAVGDPEVRARALAAGLRLLAKTDNEVVRNEYARRLSDWIKVDPDTLFLELDKVVKTGVVPTAVATTMLKRTTKEVRLEREAIKIAIQFPHLAKEHAAEVGPDLFSVPAHRTIWVAVSEGSDPSLIEDDDVRRTYTALALQPPEGSVDDRLVAEVFGRLKSFVISREIDELKGRLQRLNPIEHDEAYYALYAQLIELEAQKRRLDSDDEENRD